MIIIEKIISYLAKFVAKEIRSIDNTPLAIEQNNDTLLKRIIHIGAALKLPNSIDESLSTKWGTGGFHKLKNGMLRAEVDVSEAKVHHTEESLRRYFRCESLILRKSYPHIGNYIINISEEDLKINRELTTYNIFSIIHDTVNLFESADDDSSILVSEKYSFALNSLEKVLSEVEYSPDLELTKNIGDFFTMMNDDLSKYLKKRVDTAKDNFLEDLEVIRSINKKGEELPDPFAEALESLATIKKDTEKAEAMLDEMEKELLHLHPEKYNGDKSVIFNNNLDLNINKKLDHLTEITSGGLVDIYKKYN